jgi:hypothetical protein
MSVECDVVRGGKLIATSRKRSWRGITCQGLLSPHPPHRQLNDQQNTPFSSDPDQFSAWCIRDKSYLAGKRPYQLQGTETMPKQHYMSRNDLKDDKAIEHS